MINEIKEPGPQNLWVVQIPLIDLIGPAEIFIYGQRAADIGKSQDWASVLAVLQTFQTREFYLRVTNGIFDIFMVNFNIELTLNFSCFASLS
jgi:hypothetical protein